MTNKYGINWIINSKLECSVLGLDGTIRLWHTLPVFGAFGAGICVTNEYLKKLRVCDKSNLVVTMDKLIQIRGTDGRFITNICGEDLYRLP